MKKGIEYSVIGVSLGDFIDLDEECIYEGEQPKYKALAESMTDKEREFFLFEMLDYLWNGDMYQQALHHGITQLETLRNEAKA